MNSLDVHLHEELVGQLTKLEQGRIRFAYSAEWVAAAKSPLSASLPLRNEPFGDDDAVGEE